MVFDRFGAIGHIFAGADAFAFLASVYAYDVGNINNASVSARAFYEGGSIIENSNDAAVTSVDTILPFSAPLNLLL